MAANPEIKVVETCRVAPPPDAVVEFTVPLSFFDMQWLVSDAHHHIHFYRFRHPKPNSDFVISSIKSSLSIVLKHFLPLAGNLIWPVDSSSDRMPELRYMKGDSVSLTIAESSLDFDYLVGDHQSDSYRFCNLFPKLEEPSFTSGSEVSPLFALQVTLFPNSTGLCIGRTVHHVLGDAASFIMFNKFWVSVDKSNEDSLKLLASSSSQPLYDRSVVLDPFHLARKIFNQKKLLKSHSTSTPRLLNPTLVSKDEVRATFILHPVDIMKLKRFVLAKNPNFIGNNNPSAFTVTCALIWTCLSKSLGSEREKTEEEGAKLCAYINYRQRFDPPIPQNYFGNCTVPCMVEVTHGQLVGKEGLSVAAAAVGDAIHKRLHQDKEGFLRGDWMSPAQTTTVPPRSTIVYIIGSAQRNVHDYDADFGWGKMEKHEYVSTDSSATLMLITRSRRFKGAIEVGTSLPKSRMDAFSTIFTNSINNLHMRSPL